jgi:hypothetical protein
LHSAACARADPLSILRAAERGGADGRSGRRLLVGVENFCSGERARPPTRAAPRGAGCFERLALARAAWRRRAARVSAGTAFRALAERLLCAAGSPWPSAARCSGVPRGVPRRVGERGRRRRRGLARPTLHRIFEWRAMGVSASSRIAREAAQFAARIHGKAHEESAARCARGLVVLPQGRAAAYFASPPSGAPSVPRTASSSG